MIYLFLILFSITTQAQMKCLDLLTSPQERLEYVFTSPLKVSREEYLQILSKIANDKVSAEVYRAGGRMNVHEDKNGKVLMIDHGMEIPYHPHLKRVTEFLSTYPENFKDLLADQGILNHADDFLSFLQNCHDCKSLDPWTVRARARDAMGTVTVYRGIFITDAEAATIIKNGFVSRPLETYESYQEDTLVKAFTEPYSRQISKHIKDTASSALISVSYHPEVSIAVASRYAEEYQNADGSIYLFTLKIPKLDLIFEQHFNASDFYETRESEKEQFGFHVIGKKKKHMIFPEGPDLESLVLLRIYPSEITSVQKITKPEFRTATEY